MGSSSEETLALQKASLPFFYFAFTAAHKPCLHSSTITFRFYLFSKNSSKFCSNFKNKYFKPLEKIKHFTLTIRTNQCGVLFPHTMRTFLLISFCHFKIYFKSLYVLFYFFPLLQANLYLTLLFGLVELWPLKRLRKNSLIHAAFSAENRDSKNSSILSYLLRTLSSLMGSLATLLIECYSGQHQS